MTGRIVEQDGLREYHERGYVLPMTLAERERILNITPPDMRAVFYEVEQRAMAALGIRSAVCEVLIRPKL